MLRKLFAVAALCLFASFAHAQTPVVLSGGCGTASYSHNPPYYTVDTSGKLCVNAAVSASISGFQPGANGTPLSVTTASTTGTLPAGTVVVASNVGTNGAFCSLGASTTTSGQYIPPGGGWFAFTVGAATQLSCITSSGSTTINMVGGSGLPTGTGGGGGSGGGGGAVYGPTAAGSAAANPPVIMGGTQNGAANGVVQNWLINASGWGLIDESTSSQFHTDLNAINTSLGTLNTTAGSSIPAGTNIIGKVGIDQTTPGTTNGVDVLNQAVGTANLATGQASVSTTATQIAAARTGAIGTGRVSATICNTSTTAVYLGGAGVTTSTGQYLAGVAGACATLNTTAAIYGIVASGTETVAYSETY